MGTQKINFIGIGEHKCASTWLWYNLRAHDDVWVPPLKELHYFDRDPKYPSTCELANELLARRIFSTRSPDNLWRKKALRYIIGSVAKFDLERINWWYEFYPRDYTDTWYLSLFDRDRNVKTGEITPAYSMLDTKDIESLHALCPGVKIIFVIRDPIERAWSHLRFDAGLGKVRDITNLDEVKKYIDGEVLTKRGDYVTTLENWLSVFPDERFLTGFYDDIVSDPEIFLAEISEFLGIDPCKFPRARVARSVGVSSDRAFPREIEAYLIEKYLGDLEILAERVGKHAVTWYETALTKSKIK